MGDLDRFHAKRAAIIYNPIARGLARHKHSLQRTIAVLAQQSIEAHLVATTEPGSATVQAEQQIAAGCDLIIAAGGDGTINEVANGMLDTRVPLAILPGGTANVLAHELKIRLDVEAAAKDIYALQPCRVSVGSLRVEQSKPRCFLCMAGAGLDAQIVSGLNLRLKQATGKLAYYVCAFSHAVRRFDEFEVTVDGERFEASFALVSRVRNYGGDLEIARNASLLRDDFEVVLFRGTQGARYLGYFAGVAMKRLDRMKGCTVIRGRSVKCDAAGRQIFVQVDGELAGQLPVEASVLPEALTLLVPAEYVRQEQALVAVPVCA